MACGLFLLTSSAIASRAWPADEVPPSCLDRLAAFAAAQGIVFDPAGVSFGARWAGAGHEVRRLPGLTARIPADPCGAVLAVDLSADCRILKSRGEGACRKTFPLTYY